MQPNQSSQGNIMHFNFEGSEVRTITGECGEPWFNVSTDDAISAVSCIVNGAANTDS